MRLAVWIDEARAPGMGMAPWGDPLYEHGPRKGGRVSDSSPCVRDIIIWKAIPARDLMLALHDSKEKDDA